MRRVCVCCRCAEVGETRCRGWQGWRFGSVPTSPTDKHSLSHQESVDNTFRYSAAFYCLPVLSRPLYTILAIVLSCNMEREHDVVRYVQVV
jgi:hypothetical protein